MNAAEFYQHFERQFSAAPLPEGTKRLAGNTLKWKVPVHGGALQFKFSTNFKGAGLLNHRLWPGEFRLLLDWHNGKGKAKKVSGISIFQYTTESEAAEFTALQIRSLKKYLDAGGPDPYRTLTNTVNDEKRNPTPNIEEWCYYFDEEDASTWGRWYGALLVPWLNRFNAAPEANIDWCWRVLWPHLKRNAD